MAKSNLIDRPMTGEDKDLLGVSRYVTALSMFLTNADMPTTIAIQGEWGSGKTSVINSLRYMLCDTAKVPNENKPFHSIFLNMWEHSMLRSPEDTIERIMRSLLKEVRFFLERHGKSSSPAIDTLKKISKSRIFKAAVASGKVASSIYGGKIVGDVIDTIGSAISGKDDDYIDDDEFMPAEFRDAVAAAIQDCLAKDHESGDTQKRGFMIFVDDLDRINPESAVQILEMLKNFFEVNPCIFVLAIDYNVVVKGLKAKLGNKDENDERAYRSFFDKIIQMPFTMPTEKYNVESYVAESLKRIGYCTDDDLSVLVIDKEGEQNDLTFIKAATRITAYSTGTNPRSIKRLLNSLSLIQYMYVVGKEDNETNSALAVNNQVEKVINYAFVCMQIAYPEVYRLLVRSPVYIKWTKSTADELKIKGFAQFLKQWEQDASTEDDAVTNHETDAAAAYDEAVDAANDEADSDSKLYQAIIACFCKQGSPWLQNRTSYIIDILEMIEELCVLNNRDFESLIPAILDMSSVTAITSEDVNAAASIESIPELRKAFWRNFQKYASKEPDFTKACERFRCSRGPDKTIYIISDLQGHNHYPCGFNIRHVMEGNHFILEVYIHKKGLYDLFFEHNEELEAVVQDSLSWQIFEKPRNPWDYGMIYFRYNSNCQNRDEWPTIFEWLTSHILSLFKALNPLIHEYLIKADKSQD